MSIGNQDTINGAVQLWPAEMPGLVHDGHAEGRAGHAYATVAATTMSVRKVAARAAAIIENRMLTSRALLTRDVHASPFRVVGFQP